MTPSQIRAILLFLASIASSALYSIAPGAAETVFLGMAVITFALGVGNAVASEIG